MDDKMLQSWREGYLSDVEILIYLMHRLPASSVTDEVIEVVCKMHDEEKAEWEGRAEAFAQCGFEIDCHNEVWFNGEDK